MSRSRHSRPPLRTSSVPARILSAGLATATCVGVVGLLGARTIQANAADDESEATQAVSSEPAVAPAAPTGPVTTSNGLTQTDLDAYAAALATEKERLDAYRAKLAKAARKLAREVAAYNAAQQSRVTTSSPTRVTAVPAQPQSKPAAKPKPKAQAQTQAQSAPAAAPAPKAQPAPAPQPAPKPQSNTKGS